MSRLKGWVKARYGAIAAGVQEGCCDQSRECCDLPRAQASIGYSSEELASAPAGANLGLGCGNPLALASVEPGETVLDLGSGAGFDAFLAAGRAGPSGRVIGIDMTPEMVERARANAMEGGYANVEFRLGDVESLPLEDASVDLVISNCVLNLVPDKPKAFREIVRVLRPGGRVSISDIVLDGPLPESLQGSEDAHCSCVSGAMSRERYLAELSAAGLQEIRVVSEADAAPLVAGACCADGLDGSELAGVVTGIQVTGCKPLGGAA